MLYEAGMMNTSSLRTLKSFRKMVSFGVERKTVGQVINKSLNTGN